MPLARFPNPMMHLPTGRARLWLFSPQEWWSYVLLTGTFAVTRWLYWQEGIRYDARPLSYYFQYLDVALLRARLLESLLHMHGQPPLFNLFLGFVVKCCEAKQEAVFHWLYMGMGLGVSLLVYALAREVGVSRGLSFGLALGYQVNPSSVLYENVLVYAAPVAFLGAASAYFLSRGLSRRAGRQIFVGLLLLAVLVGIRSSFHLLFYTAAVGYLLLAAPVPIRRQIVLAAIVPFLVAASFFLKNGMLYGRFASSTWLGMNLWRVTAQALDPHLRQELVAGGHMELSDRHTFLPLEGYPEKYWRTIVETCAGPPVLCNINKSEGGTNFNHAAYLAISDALLRDDLYAVQHDPGVVARRILSGTVHYLWPGSTFLGVQENLTKIAAWVDAWDRFIFLRLSVPGRQDMPDWSRLVYPGMAAWFIAGLGWGLLGFLRASFAMGRVKPDPRLAIVGLIGYLVMYGFVVGNLFEYGENMRYRFETAALSVVLFGHLLSVAGDKARGWLWRDG